jgi:hypothetical protein
MEAEDGADAAFADASEVGEGAELAVGVAVALDVDIGTGAVAAAALAMGEVMGTLGRPFGFMFARLAKAFGIMG